MGKHDGRGGSHADKGRGNDGQHKGTGRDQIGYPGRQPDSGNYKGKHESK